MRNHRDYLAEHLASVPAFRALLRSVEARMIASLELPRPILDLGCGDGQFAEASFTEPLDVGIDPSPVAIAEAKRRGMHCDLRVGVGGALPFPDGAFSVVECDAVLEHVQDASRAMRELERVTVPGGMIHLGEHRADWLGKSNFGTEQHAEN